MSASLARLRKLFDDPLLVREGRGLVTTPTAESLAGQISDALRMISGALRGAGDFDPAADERSFTILASDYVLLVLLRSLLDEVGLEAPHVRVIVRPIEGDYGDHLRSGSADMFILPREIERSGVPTMSADLFSDRLVCAVDDAHPTVNGPLTLEQFSTLPYLAYQGSALPSVSQLQLRALGIDRTVDISTQSFVVAPLLLRGTRYFTLVFERLARALPETSRMVLSEPPVPLSPVTIAMFWSPRHEENAAHRWLRERLVKGAASLG